MNVQQTRSAWVPVILIFGVAFIVAIFYLVFQEQERRQSADEVRDRMHRVGDAAAANEQARAAAVIVVKVVRPSERGLTFQIQNSDNRPATDVQLHVVDAGTNRLVDSFSIDRIEPGETKAGELQGVTTPSPRINVISAKFE